MSFFKILLEADSEKEFKKKQACALLIVITTILLIVSVIAFAICQVVNITAGKSPDEEKDTAEEAINLGETTTKELSPTAVNSGNLLTLNSTARYKGDVDVVNLQKREDRPQTEASKNAYTVLPAVQSKFHATDATATALNKMLKAFYEAKKDDNLLISGAYDTSEVDSQEPIFSSGEAIALSYFHDYANNGINDQRSIAGVDTYKWIYANAHKYGFVAASANSNVFRYIGVTHASAAKLKGLTLDKYLNQLKNATPEAPMRLDSSGTYVAYYCPIDNVIVPKNYSSEISGNNIDGVIVTVNLSSQVSDNVEN